MKVVLDAVGSQDHRGPGAAYFCPCCERELVYVAEADLEDLGPVDLSSVSSVQEAVEKALRWRAEALENRLRAAARWHSCATWRQRRRFARLVGPHL